MSTVLQESSVVIETSSTKTKRARRGKPIKFKGISEITDEYLENIRPGKGKVWNKRDLSVVSNSLNCMNAECTTVAVYKRACFDIYADEILKEACFTSYESLLKEPQSDDYVYTVKCVDRLLEDPTVSKALSQYDFKAVALGLIRMQANYYTRTLTVWAARQRLVSAKKMIRHKQELKREKRIKLRDVSEVESHKIAAEKLKRRFDEAMSGPSQDSMDSNEESQVVKQGSKQPYTPKVGSKGYKGQMGYGVKQIRRVTKDPNFYQYNEEDTQIQGSPMRVFNDEDSKQELEDGMKHLGYSVYTGVVNRFIDVREKALCAYTKLSSALMIGHLVDKPIQELFAFTSDFIREYSKTVESNKPSSSDDMTDEDEDSESEVSREDLD